MGEGEFGPVMLAYKISSSMERSEVAVKMLLPPSAGAPRFHLSVVLSDFASQMQLQHSNICGILGLCTDAEPYYIIYEYLDKVSISANYPTTLLLSGHMFDRVI